MTSPQGARRLRDSVARLRNAASQILGRFNHDQRGAIVFMFAIIIMIGVGAVALDYGSLVVERRDQQKSVDSMVLAGVQELPDDTLLADQYGREWGLRNGVAAPEIVNLTLDNTCWNNHPQDDPDLIDSITADISRGGKLFFLSELGYSIDVGAHAKACVGSLRESDGLRPWSISILNSPCFEPLDPAGDLNDPYNYQPLYGQECVIRLESPSSQVGSIRLGDAEGEPCSPPGGGAKSYTNNIKNGSVATCEIGDIVDTEPGLQVGPTLAAMAALLSGEGACDAIFGPPQGTFNTFDQLLESFSVPGGLIPSPDTVFVPRSCPGSPLFDDDPGTPDTVRFVTLVLIDEFDSPNGFGSEPIIGFAGFFIDRCDVLEKDGVTITSYPRCDVPKGDQANVAIVGTFIQYLKLGGPGGPLNPFGTRIYALVE